MVARQAGFSSREPSHRKNQGITIKVIAQNIACPVKCRLWRPLTGI
jgi:hypothetical protein